MTRLRLAATLAAAAVIATFVATAWIAWKHSGAVGRRATPGDDAASSREGGETEAGSQSVRAPAPRPEGQQTHRGIPPAQGHVSADDGGDSGATSRAPPASDTPQPVPGEAEAPPASEGDVAKEETPLTLDLGQGVTLKLVRIPAGTFMMGSPKDDECRHRSEEPQHEVTISKPFYMGTYEVTQEQYEAVMGSNPSEFKGPHKPVHHVSWVEATTFCEKVSQKTGRRVRLPTEAEWEYACRAGSKGWFRCRDWQIIVEYAKCLETPPRNSDVPQMGPAPVGSYKPNAWGLYDMHGNAKEWVSDCTDDFLPLWGSYATYANAGTKDPTGPESGKYRILRGGAWNRPAGACRSANRWSNFPTYRLPEFGLRVAADVE